MEMLTVMLILSANGFVVPPVCWVLWAFVFVIKLAEAIVNYKTGR